MEAILIRVDVDALDYYKKKPDDILDFIEEIDNPSVLNVDQSWDGITFLLTGQGLSESNPHPLKHIWVSKQNSLVESTDQLPHGIHILYPNEVQDLSDQLHQALLIDPLIVYDAQKMSDLGIFPNFWLQDIEEDLPNYLMDYLEELGNFYYAAAEAGEAILVVFI